MSAEILGIHHVTAIASDPQRNLDFYVGLLGLRFVKKTVNFDDPHTYHFYFGDDAGNPGSIMTFFPWPHAHRGRQGTGQVAVTSFAVLPSALGFWIERLLKNGIKYKGPVRRADDEQVLAFTDHDGLMLEIVAHAGAEKRGAWASPAISRDNAIHGFHSVTLWEENGDETERVLVDTLGFQLLRKDGGTRRYTTGDAGPGAIVDVRTIGGFLSGQSGAGTVHHVAWRVADATEELTVRSRVLQAGYQPTPVIDRTYFQSVYFREPGGVLFEIATDPPGFAVDEAADRLGEGLMLPPQYEPHRAEISAVLPRVQLPDANAGPDRFTALTAGTADADADDLGFVHRYVPAADGTESRGTSTLLLLHGTGGDEDAMIAIGRALLPGAALLSPRGKVDERGALRFFRRIREGVFDQKDLELRTAELAEFVVAAAARYSLARGRIAVVGFSNGANIAGSLLLRRPELLRAAVLLSPMVPFEPEPLPDLEGIPVFIGAGRRDAMVPPALTERLADLLRRAGADVRIHWDAGGHAVTESEIAAAAQWLRDLAG